MLKNRSSILHTRSVLLTLLRLCDHITHNGTKALRSVQFNLEGLSSEKLVYAIDPERFNIFEVYFALVAQSVQKRDVLRHIAKTAARSTPPFGRQDSVDSMPL